MGAGVLVIKEGYLSLICTITPSLFVSPPHLPFPQELYLVILREWVELSEFGGGLKGKGLLA